jgi:hypothetical protein
MWIRLKKSRRPSLETEDEKRAASYIEKPILSTRSLK